MERLDEPGLIPAVEVLVGTLTIQRCIEEPARTGQISLVIAEGRDTYGMQTFNQSVIDLYQRGLVGYEEARRAATSATDFEVEIEKLSLVQEVAARPVAAIGPPGSPGRQARPAGH
jgi:twitching motility protein PilT